MTLAVGLRLGVLRHRLGGKDAPPRNALWGDAVRLVALMGLLAHATFGVTSLGLMLWAMGRLPWLPLPPLQYDLVFPTGRCALGLPRGQPSVVTRLTSRCCLDSEG